MNKAGASVVSLSLKESEQRFSEHNLEVIAERYNIDIAEAQVVQAKLFENPVVSLEQNVYNRLNGRYFDFGKQGETIVEVEQLIYIAGQRNKRVRLEKINKEMALYQFEEVLRTLRSELKEKFIALYFTRKSQSIYDREIDSLAHLLVVLKEQNEKGNVSLLEKSRIEALLLSLRQERNDIANQVISLQGDMRLLLGISGNDTFEPIFDESVLNQIDMDSVPFSVYETLMTREERVRSEDMGGYYRVAADGRDLNYDKFVVKGQVETQADESYTSHNTRRLNVDETVAKLLTTDYVKAELANWGK